MENKSDNFVVDISPDGGFLQSDWWTKFQEATGKKNLNIKGGAFWRNIIEHKLPIAGRYFYIPRGNIFRIKDTDVKNYLNNLIELAKSSRAGWIRIEPSSQEVLTLIKKNTKLPIVKAPHNMQPKELFIIDIMKSEEQLIAEMKPKTRYNIRLAEKKNVKIFISNKKEHIDRFCDLVEITANRQGIKPHPRNYYQKMFAVIPEKNIKLYCAEFEGPASTRGDDRSSTRGGDVIAANAVIFFGDTVTYLHGASDDRFRNVMAPYLLQWKQIQDAKKNGAKKYDFGGVKTEINEKSRTDWSGITHFKQGFSPSTKAIEFPGSYDIIINLRRYFVYRTLQKVKHFCYYYLKKL